MYLNAIQHDLLSIEKLLNRYHEKNGRFPTNDEGLRVLRDHFSEVVDASTPVYPSDLKKFANKGYCEEAFILHPYFLDPVSIKSIRKQLREDISKSIRGSSPINDYRDNGKDITEKAVICPLEYGFTEDDHVHLLSSGEILSPWLFPYMYENHRDHVNDFTASPVRDDWWRQYSRQVADGIYIYSVSGITIAPSYNAKWWGRYGPRMIGAGMILAVIVMLFLRRLPRLKLMIGSSIIGTLIGGLQTHGIFITCYVMSRPFSFRNPKTMERQVALLEAYRAKGIISPDTCDRLIAKTRLELLDGPFKGDATDPIPTGTNAETEPPPTPPPSSPSVIQDR